MDWLRQIPPQLAQIIERLLPLPSTVQKLRAEVDRLEMEVITLGNILIDKGIVTTKEVEAMSKTIMEKKRLEMQENDVSERMTYDKQKLVKDELDGIVGARIEHKKAIEEQNKKVRDSVRRSPRGHNIK